MILIICKEVPEQAVGSPSVTSPKIRYIENWSEDVICNEEQTAVNLDVSKCKVIYELLGNSKKMLITFCCGQKTDDGLSLINLMKACGLLRQKEQSS